MAKPACMNMTRKPVTKRPDEVDGDLVLPNLVGDIGKRYASLGVGCRNVADGSGERASGIALCQVCRSGRFTGGVLEFGIGRSEAGAGAAAAGAAGAATSERALLRPHPRQVQKYKDLRQQFRRIFFIVTAPLSTQRSC